MTFIIILLIVLLIAFFIWFYFKHININFNTICMVTGAPKTGKSLLSIYLCKQALTKARIKWYIQKIFSIIFRKKFTKDKPQLYSNIPLNIKGGYIPLTKDMLLRKEKIIDSSVMYLGEFSLIANSRIGQKYGVKNNIDYDTLNEELLLFTKLCGHQFNGKVIIDSQCISDVHYSIKRVLSNYFYIHHSKNLPFFKLLFIQELRYSDDNSTLNVNDVDKENNLRWFLIPKRKYYKMYDYRCYSLFTDNLISDSKPIIPSNLKANDIVSFSEYKTLHK